MRVLKTNKEPEGIPDYYSIHIGWARRAEKTGENADFRASIHYARLAEEFGLAVIEDDDTWDDVTRP